MSLLFFGFADKVESVYVSIVMYFKFITAVKGFDGTVEKNGCLLSRQDDIILSNCDVGIKPHRRGSSALWGNC